MRGAVLVVPSVYTVPPGVRFVPGVGRHDVQCRMIHDCAYVFIVISTTKFLMMGPGKWARFRRKLILICQLVSHR